MLAHHACRHGMYHPSASSLAGMSAGTRPAFSGRPTPVGLPRPKRPNQSSSFGSVSRVATLWK